MLGDSVGCVDGISLGYSVGDSVGDIVGVAVGKLESTSEGKFVGFLIVARVGGTKFTKILIA